MRSPHVDVAQAPCPKKQTTRTRRLRHTQTRHAAVVRKRHTSQCTAQARDARITARVAAVAAFEVPPASPTSSLGASARVGRSRCMRSPRVDVAQAPCPKNKPHARDDCDTHKQDTQQWYFYTSTPLHLYTSTHLHIYTSTHIHIYTSTSTRLHIYTSTRLHVYTSTHLHIYTSTQR